MRTVLADLLVSIITLAALGSLVFGCWQIYHPLAWIVCGLVGMLLANGLQRGAKK